MKIAIITNIIPSYREGFYDRLFSLGDLSVTVYCQDHIPGMNLKPIHEKYGERIKIVKFISVNKGLIAWQFLPWRRIIKGYDVVFVSGNPRVLSDMLISFILRIAGKGLVIWTQAHSFGANTLTERIRIFWTRLFQNIFVYTDAEAINLRAKGFKDNFILGMNNGLDQKLIDTTTLAWTEPRLKEWRHSNSLDNMVLLLSCARLDSKNKFEQIIQALPLMLTKIPNLLWCLIGNGDERNKLETLVKSAGLDDHVRFVGAIYDENELAPWFLSSEFLIHPASIGLSLLHSFGYGLPVVINADTKLHGPEYAAFEPELTGRNFITGNIQSLANTVIGLISDRTVLLKMKNHSIYVARQKYNVDIMVDRFLTIAKEACKQ